MSSINGSSPDLENLILLIDQIRPSSTDAASSANKRKLAEEESKLEKEIIKVILSGKTDSLKPNSGQSVSIGDHHICIGFQDQIGSDYRVWEWHGHIMLFDGENGYTPQYIYGNFFEKVKAGGIPAQKKQEGKEEKLDYKDLIELLNSALKS